MIMRAKSRLFQSTIVLFVVVCLMKSGSLFCAKMVRLCIASVDPAKLSSQCVMCSRREFPLTAIDCTGITKMNQLISSPLSVQEATCLIFNCRRVSYFWERIFFETSSNSPPPTPTASAGHQAGALPRIREPRSQDQLPIGGQPNEELRGHAAARNVWRRPEEFGLAPALLILRSQPNVSEPGDGPGQHAGRELQFHGRPLVEFDGRPGDAVRDCARALHKSIRLVVAALLQSFSHISL